MKKLLFVTVLVFLFMLAGCGSENPNTSDLPSQLDKGVSNLAFVGGMGCDDQSCTDVSHYHDCPSDCTDYDHYHSCALDCSDVEHHHSQGHHQDDHQTDASVVTALACVSGMGCNDQSCTDVSHHHDCPTDCADYDHYHNCNLDCAATSHHHNSQTVSTDHEEHHDDSHH